QSPSVFSSWSAYRFWLRLLTTDTMSESGRDLWRMSSIESDESKTAPMSSMSSMSAAYPSTVIPSRSSTSRSTCTKYSVGFETDSDSTSRVPADTFDAITMSLLARLRRYVSSASESWATVSVWLVTLTYDVRIGLQLTVAGSPSTPASTVTSM